MHNHQIEEWKVHYQQIEESKMHYQHGKCIINMVNATF